MRASPITLTSILAAILTLPAAGCVRYYAGVGYGSTWQGSTSTTQGYAAGPGAMAPVVIVGETTGSGVVVSAGGTAAGTGTGTGIGIGTASVAGSVAGSGTATGSGSGTVTGSGSGSGTATGSGTVLVVEAPRLAASGTASLGLGGLVGDGVAASGGLARLDALGALHGRGLLEGGVTLYADAHVSIRASLAHDALPTSGGETSVVLEVTGLAPPASRPPLRVHLVIDASTSMRGAWASVKDAALAVVGHLRPQDELQIVVYGTTATEALAPIAIGDGARARAVIQGLSYGGRTNIESGLRLAYGATRPAGRSLVVVISDGVPQGGLSGADELGALAGQAHADAGAVTLAIGLGTEFHTGILSALGQAGGGDFRIAPRPPELRALLEVELQRHGAIVLSDLDATLSPTAGVTLAASAPSLSLGAVIAGETRTFVVPVTTSHAGTLAHVRVRFLDASGRPMEAEAALSLAPGATAVPRGAMAAVLDLALAEALRGAGRAIENGDGAAAAALLRANVLEAEAALSARPSVEAAQRNQATLRIAEVLPPLVAEASWGQRRSVGATFVEWAFGLTR